MELKQLFKVSSLAAAIALAGCGGDINISEGDIDNSVNNSNNTTNNNTGSTPTTPTTPDTPVTPDLPGEESTFLSNEVSQALGQDVTVRTLTGRLIPTDGDATVTLTNDVVWAVEGPLFVGNDNADQVDLEIEPGTIVFGRNGEDYIVVSRGSKIEAQGTATNPIIMTSYNDVIGGEVAPGQWGGLVILGNAPSTKCPQDGSDCALQVEGAQEGAVFGGTDSADNSGTLNYVVVKYAGFEIAPDNELNGITFGGVGSGTTVDYVQVHSNADDGFEFFGGSVNAKHLVLTGNLDDSVDWDNGYNGRIQYVFVEHATDNSEANRGIEGDGDGGDGTAFSAPVVANMTILGNTYDTADKDSEGVLLRDQTGATLMNFLISGPEGMGECLEADEGSDEEPDTTVTANLADGTITMTNSVIACSEPVKSGTTDLEAWFTGQDGNMIVDVTDDSAVTALGINTDGSITSESTLLGAGADPSAVDGFFDSVDYIGAIGTNDWRQGWAFGYGGGTINVVNSASGCPAGTVTISSVDGTTTTCELSGTVTSDVTLTAGNLYSLSGAVFVGGDNENSATLTVEPGVTVFGESGEDYIVVSRGSQIDANGTASSPITFTSRQHVVGGLEAGTAGQWGGMIILGNAPSTKCPQDGSACALQVEGAQEGAVFGGTNSEDNSGTLRYVRVMHGGFEIAPDNELNGITFGGVGSGTTIEYVQVHKNADDGVEFFGGSVSAKYLVLTGIQDDSVDWDNGYNGNMQFVLVKHAEDGSDANRGIEGDGDGGEGTAFSNPMVANMTIIGNSFDTTDADSEGVLLRDQTNAQLYNFVVTGAAGECFEADLSDGDTTLEANMNGTNDPQLTFQSSVLACSENIKNSGDFDQETWFTSQANNSLLGADAAVLNGIYTIDATTAVDVNALNSFFTTTDFIGAVKDADNDWTAGWTVGLE
ncbi:MAG: hypothetical protein GJ680_08550 [Alteromonadaceae bacterium]|nr:hypothetical protein [Alteromonadaceae bacterium]